MNDLLVSIRPSVLFVLALAGDSSAFFPGMSARVERRKKRRRADGGQSYTMLRWEPRRVLAPH